MTPLHLRLFNHYHGVECGYVLNVFPSFEGQPPTPHCSSPSSSPLLFGNSDTYLAGLNQYNWVLGQGSIWWG